MSMFTSCNHVPSVYISLHLSPPCIIICWWREKFHVAKYYISSRVAVRMPGGLSGIGSCTPYPPLYVPHSRVLSSRYFVARVQYNITPTIFAADSHSYTTEPWAGLLFYEICSISLFPRSPETLTRQKIHFSFMRTPHYLHGYDFIRRQGIECAKV